MIQRNVAGCCVQETWRLGNFITTIRGHTVIHHGMEKKNNLKVRISAGVAVILNPVLTKAWSKAGKLPPITSDNSLNFSGRMIRVTICFPCSSNRPKEAYSRETNKSIKSLYVQSTTWLNMMNKNYSTTSWIHFILMPRGIRKLFQEKI